MWALTPLLFWWMQTHLTMAVINSGVASYYVCFAEDPATLRRNDPEFYEIMWSRQGNLRGGWRAIQLPASSKGFLIVWHLKVRIPPIPAPCLLVNQEKSQIRHWKNYLWWRSWCGRQQRFDYHSGQASPPWRTRTMTWRAGLEAASVTIGQRNFPRRKGRGKEDWDLVAPFWRKTVIYIHSSEWRALFALQAFKALASDITDVTIACCWLLRAYYKLPYWPADCETELGLFNYFCLKNKVVSASVSSSSLNSRGLYSSARFSLPFPCREGKDESVFCSPEVISNDDLLDSYVV